jgi:flagella basal body P-ring formation protein FlgA
MIRFISICLLTTLPVALLAQPALAQNAPALKPAASIASEIVTLGDLIANAGTKAEFAVFRAPDLGQTGTVTAQDILAAAALHGLKNVETGGLDSVAVTRASRAVAADEIRLPLMTALSLQAGMDDLEAIDVKLDAGLAKIQLPVEADGPVQIEDAVWHKDRGTFDAALIVRRIDGRDERRVLRGQALETFAVVTASRTLERGTVVTPQDVEIERRPKNAARNDSLSDVSIAIGMEVRRSVRDGQPLRAADLVQPTLVKSGSTVTIILKTRGLTLTASAQALGDGKTGESIQVMNVQSKRVLQAVVTGRDEVTVQPPRTLASAAK